MKSKIQYTLLFLSVLSFTILIGRSFRVGEIPNGIQNSCENCHLNPAGGGPRNNFGKQIEANFLSDPGSAGHVVWGPELAALDSDGDGKTNGEELQDPDGTWSAGDPQPGDPALVTNPGIPDATGIDETSPFAFELRQNYPNPFSKGSFGKPSTEINYSIPFQSFVLLSVYDALGNKVADLVSKNLSAGNYKVTFNASDLPSGIYFYLLKANNLIKAKKMILLK